jgi:hypothetical protein
MEIGDRRPGHLPVHECAMDFIVDRQWCRNRSASRMPSSERSGSAAVAPGLLDEVGHLRFAIGSQALNHVVDVDIRAVLAHLDLRLDTGDDDLDASN